MLVFCHCQVYGFDFLSGHLELGWGLGFFLLSSKAFWDKDEGKNFSSSNRNEKKAWTVVIFSMAIQF